MKLILASKSPRRKELIQGLGFDFEIIHYEVEESFDPTDSPQEISIKLALKKAQHFPRDLKTDEILITADTIVWVQDEILNKPENEQEALQMLRKICGNKHVVYTGVCVKTTDETISFSESTNVFCKSQTDDELLYYIRNFHPFDKAGSYGIQDWFGYTAVEKIEGCFYNVMGLPVSRLFQELKKIKKK